jgi:hypothetical protein
VGAVRQRRAGPKPLQHYGASGTANSGSGERAPTRSAEIGGGQLAAGPLPTIADALDRPERIAADKPTPAALTSSTRLPPHFADDAHRLAAHFQSHPGVVGEAMGANRTGQHRRHHHRAGVG